MVYFQCLGCNRKLLGNYFPPLHQRMVPRLCQECASACKVDQFYRFQNETFRCIQCRNTRSIFYFSRFQYNTKDIVCCVCDECEPQLDAHLHPLLSTEIRKNWIIGEGDANGEIYLFNRASRDAEFNFHARWGIWTWQDPDLAEVLLLEPFHDIWMSAKNRAKEKGREFSITEADLAEIFFQQSGQCALSGIKFTPNEMPSPDRIDSGLGYTRTNVELVLKRVNRMKLDLPKDKFVETCLAIAANSRSMRTSANHAKIS